MEKVGIVVVCISALLLCFWVGKDLYRSSQVVKVSAKPEDKKIGDATKVLWALENGVEPDYGELEGECDFVDGRYDKADFSIQTLLRLTYKYEDVLPETSLARMKESFLGFKYWMDQPGEDGMCYWSENHQILFASAEYLAGQYYPDLIFTNDGKTGQEHEAMGKEWVLAWLELRWLYGFTEWYSNVYYKEDIMALSNLIEFSEDQEVVIKSQIVMDLLLYDMASQSYKGNFLSTSGRSYEANKINSQGNRMIRVSEAMFGYDLNAEDKKNGLDLNVLYMSGYDVPEVLKAIAQDSEPAVIKASNGLDLRELRSEGLLGQSDEQMMMQWGMEAFTNPEVINNSLDYINKHNLYSNEFLYDFKQMNIGAVRYLGLLPLISDTLNLKTNGVAIQRANTYTYRHPDYMLATAQNYHPGTFGDQQHIWAATLPGDVSVFTTHPASPYDVDAGLTGSPNYWVGSGRLPHSVQEKNMNMTIYQIPDKKGFMEDHLLTFTHAYFPKDLMDEVVLEGHYIFGRVQGTYIGMIGENPLAFRGDSSTDLIQEGQITYWITELSSDQSESFQGFQERLKNNTVSYEEHQDRLTYRSGEKSFELTYKGEFSVNGDRVSTAYLRFDAPYAQAEAKAQEIWIEKDGKSLFLDFNALKRVVSD